MDIQKELRELSFNEILSEGYKRARIQLDEGDPEEAGKWLIQAGRMLIEKDEILQKDCKLIPNNKNSRR